MKKSIAYLPKRKQDDLRRLTEMIRKRLPEAELIVLYGSYARNEYVDYDERVEFGIPTSYRSDYDILVATSGITDKAAGQILDRVDELYYTDPDRQTPVEFINDDIKKLNKDLSEGRYFYTQVKQEGVILYDSGRFKLARRRKLRYDEIKQQAEEYFEEKFEWANSFLEGAKFYYSRKEYRMTSFLLHQTCENYYYAIRLVFTLQNSKQHNLTKLASSVRKYSEELPQVFPRDTTEEKRLFKLLKAAYVEARYNPKFVVTREDIIALFQKVERLREITQRLCKAKLEEYGRLI
ncbi:MAG: HEPN domain-containing protein [Tannerellaceae bacterium]|nr:HEPN domain-containing protein [Tannerellaceae bacterium]